MLFGIIFQYRHLNKITISQSALENNHKLIQPLYPNSLICPVLKSNAYGHGIKQVAQIFDNLDCGFLVVDSLYEAYELYKLNVKTKILIMGYTSPVNFTVKDLPFEICVWDLETAQVLDQHQPGCNIHLFIDTGMRREGILLEDFAEFVDTVLKLRNLNIVGLCSHFADIDNADMNFTNAQIQVFKEALKILQAKGVTPRWRHISASGGLSKVSDQVFNMARVGLAHYGVTNEQLRPVLEFETTLSATKKINRGESIGYNCTFKAKKDMLVGLLPAGYYEGIDRRLSNTGFVKIRGDFYQIVGRVSMNMTTIDITELESPVVGENVTVYSADKRDINSVDNVAVSINAIPYELLVHLAESVKRLIVE